MDKDNEMYVTSNGELYKKGVEQAIYPQTNYTTQQFYTKEEYDRLQAEYDELYKYNVALENDYRDLEQENKQLKKLKFKSDGIELLQDANLNLHNANVKYRQALQEIRDIVSEQCQQCFVIDGFTKPDDCGICDYKRIIDKINEVMGVE